MNEAGNGRAVIVQLPVGSARIGANGDLRLHDAEGCPAAAGSGVAAAIAALVTADRTHPPGPMRVERDLSDVVPGRTESGFGDHIDMSSWNVIVDDTVIVKAARQVGSGDRGPRLVRAISRREPGITPPLLGTLALETEAGPRILVSVTRLVPDAVDGWTWAVSDLLGLLQKKQSEPSWPGEIGALVARLHRALAAETTTDSGDDRSAADRSVDPPFRVPVATPLASSPQDDATVRLRARLEALQSAITSTPPIRATSFDLHGDLHVGQFLRAPDSTVSVIDFDGDPQLCGRDLRGDAAIDVAHILVSIDLVGAVVQRRIGHADSRVDAWCDRARDALLTGYRNELIAHGCQELLDEDRLPGLMALQLMRELDYAATFLPRWRYAPDYAITRRFAATPTRRDIPWTPPPFALTST